MPYTAKYFSDLGPLLLESVDGKALSSLRFIKEDSGTFSTGVGFASEPDIFVETRMWLDAYFSGEKVSPRDILMEPKEGSDFARSVWRLLCLIPYGQTTTYGELAKEIAKERGLKKMSAQAIGGAVGRNPIAIIIPCHRVIGAGGNLTGFGGGLSLKVKLLHIERAYKPSFFLPRGENMH